MQVFITGVSKGLGKALAEKFLSNGSLVVGIGRSHSIEHENFSFLPCELRRLEEVKRIRFRSNSQEAILINCAGIIGNIQRISDQEHADMEDVMTVNTLAPMYFCQQFLKQMPNDLKLTIINISSGAANRAIPGWASYCASKIALDRFSETIFLEEQEKGRNVRVFSIAPGVIDTDMQVKIRSAHEDNFSSLEMFVDLKQNNELLSPNDVANKLLELAQSTDKKEVVLKWSDI